MSTFPPLSSLPPGLHAPTAGWDHARPASGGTASTGDAAQQFGFVGDQQAARALTVPPSSGEGATQLEARFLACLFQG